MKHIRSFTFVIFLLTMIYSCSIAKRKLEQRYVEQSATSSTSEAWRSFSQRDSSKRYWSVVTDSIFYYHPDSGLWASGGWLYAEEQTLHVHNGETAIRYRDSVLYSQELSEKSKKVVSTNRAPWYVYLAIIVVGVLVVGGWWRK